MSNAPRPAPEQGATSGPEASWRAHLAAAAGGDDGHLLGAVLAAWGREAGARGAALYVADQGVLYREEVWGDGEYPATLGAEAHPERERPDGERSAPLPGRLPITGGALIHHPAELAPAAGEASEAFSMLGLLARLCAFKRRLKRQNFEAGIRGVEQEALYSVGLAITSTLDLDSLIDAVLSWALSLLDARRAALYLRAGSAGANGDAAADADAEPGRFHLSRALGGEALPTFFPPSAAEAVEGDDEGALEARLPEELLPGASYLLAAPVQTDSQPRGFLVVADKESRRGVGPFGEDDRRTLTLFANQAAIALENAHLHQQALEKERLEREMELAADIQRQILPKASPAVPGYEVVGWSRPARQVGGDYYDFLPRPDGKLIVTVGDVSGKGMPAALMVSILHSALRLMLDRSALDAGLIERLNRHVLESSAPNKFITLLTGELDPEGHRLEYVNAGHNPGLVMGPDGNVRHLASSGLPVGLLPLATYQASRVELGPGDLVCLYSDGITEAANPQGEELDMDRLIEVLRGCRNQPLPVLVRSVEEAAADFAEGAPQGDDQTVVLIRRLAFER